ncbi:Uma2 family endonuclease [Sphingomonas bacterium]|uniref:Uma2 family endonuclease n=1 Tax=Sphingomonas bacterium TaxID=1895847 RepID=UPI001576C565|nr:Uma2 family endonuclease [Sphingomonas bacterium]
MAARPDYPLTLLTEQEFLEITFGDLKAELEHGVIRMMAGAKARHNKVALNIQFALMRRLQGTGCTPYGPDQGIRTVERTIRYPAVAVLCGHDGSNDDDVRLFDDPRVLFEIASAGTFRTDVREKLLEYRALTSVDTIVLVDIGTERVRVVQRIGPDGWSDVGHQAAFDIPLPSLGITLPHAEIFAR